MSFQHNDSYIVGNFKDDYINGKSHLSLNGQRSVDATVSGNDLYIQNCGKFLDSLHEILYEYNEELDEDKFNGPNLYKY